MRNPVISAIARAAALVAGILAAQPAFAAWADWRWGPSDAELEQVVRVAYTAAAAYARHDTNYFARDGVAGVTFFTVLA